MTPDRYEDIAYEMPRELARDEARIVNRRAAAIAQTRVRPPMPLLPDYDPDDTEDDDPGADPPEPEFDDDEIAEGRLRAMDYDAWADL